MASKNRSIVVSDLKIKGNITEKENIIIDGEVEGDINANIVETFKNLYIIDIGRTLIGNQLKVPTSCT